MSSIADNFGAARRLPGSSSRALPRLPGRYGLGNAWYALLVVTGIAIVTVAGYAWPTETPDVAGGFLKYEVTAGAWIFATATLPLVFLWARRAGATKRESLLLWFVLNTITYCKDFAYIPVPVQPIFVTDVTLALLLISLVIERQFGWQSFFTPTGKRVLFLFSVGAFSVLRAIVLGHDPLLIARDSMMVGYSMFLMVGLAMFRSWDAVKRFLCVSTTGVVFLTVCAVARFAGDPGARRYIDTGSPYVMSALLIALCLTMRRCVRPALGYVLAAVCALGVVLAQARTVYVGSAAAIVLMFVMPSGRRNSTARLKSLLYMTAVIAVIVVVLAQTRAGADYISNVETELISGTVDWQQDDNAYFRFMAWAEAIDRFSANPLFGEGYGVPFSFNEIGVALVEGDPRPHNTYLTQLYKTGIVGLTPFVLLIGWAMWFQWRTARKLRDHPYVDWLWAFWFAELAFCFFGSLNLMLESPFIASGFWLLLAAGVSIATLISAPKQHFASAAAAT